MPTQLQFRRGTTSQNNSFTGAVGTIVGFGNTTAPTGWLVCNDAAVSRSTYARLFAVTGTSFGTGDGSSNFNVPDLRDRVALGYGTNMSSLGAATTGIAASAVITTGSDGDGDLTVTTATFATSAKDSSQSSAATAVNQAAHTHTLTLPSQVVQFIIKT